MARDFPATGHLVDMARSGHHTDRAMEQDIRFCELDGRRIAYATVGEGPLLAVRARGGSRTSRRSGTTRGRGASSRSSRSSHRVVRYDRLGAGLSDRDLSGAADDRVRDARARGGARRAAARRRRRSSRARAPAWRRRASRAPRPSACARSSSSAATSRGATCRRRRAARSSSSPALNWPLAAQMFAGLLVPHASGDEIATLSRHLRPLCDADTAAAFLELELTADARPYLPRVTMPTLVLHRRGDRTVPIGHGRELASLLPNARFVALGGDAHLPLDGRAARAPSRARRLPRRHAQRRVERRLAAQSPRGRGAASRRGRPLEPRDRVVSRPQRAHGAPPRREHPAQAHAVLARRRPPRRRPGPATSRAARRGRPARRRDRGAARSAGPRTRPTAPCRRRSRRLSPARSSSSTSAGLAHSNASASWLPGSRVQSGRKLFTTSSASSMKRAPLGSVASMCPSPSSGRSTPSRR